MEYTLDKYIENTAEIRRLSSPQISEIEDAEGYRRLLRENFVKIGELAKENRGILDEQFYPVIVQEESIADDQMEMLGDFSEKLLDAYNLVNLDPHIHAMLTERLVNDAAQSESDDMLIKQLDADIMACYVMVNMTRRIISKPEIAADFRRRGFEAWERMEPFLAHDKFAALSSESKELVLINSRYITVLNEGVEGSPEGNQKNIDMLERTLSFCDDPFYRAQVPDYDWDYHKFRALEYVGMLCEYHNERHFTPTQCCYMREREEQLYEMWQSDPVYYEEQLPEVEIKMNILRARYEGGEISCDTYMRELVALYENRVPDGYRLVDIYTHLLTPLEYMLSVDTEHITEQQCQQLGDFYQNMINYVYHMQNMGALSYLLEYFSAILENFIEVPGLVTFEDICLNALAAMHPPTYVHTMMVGKLTRCLCRHLLNLKPELFTQMKEAMELDDASVISFAYHAAVCHDFGKMPIIDTIMVYGRKILDQEFELIKQHPDMGSIMMSKYESTKRYANIARGHHKWYDNTKGYPAEFDTSTVPEKIIIDIVTCADCLDASTDTVGRSYNVGKTIDEFLGELREGSGTRYAPFLPELFERPEVRADIDYLLKQGRKENYLDTYVLLKEVQERSSMKR